MKKITNHKQIKKGDYIKYCCPSGEVIGLVESVDDEGNVLEKEYWLKYSEDDEFGKPINQDALNYNFKDFRNYYKLSKEEIALSFL